MAGETKPLPGEAARDGRAPNLKVLKPYQSFRLSLNKAKNSGNSLWPRGMRGRSRAPQGAGHATFKAAICRAERGDGTSQRCSGDAFCISLCTSVFQTIDRRTDRQISG